MPSDVNSVYRAQASAADVFRTELFPCYTPEYIASQKGVTGTMLWGYSKAYDGASLMGRGLQVVASPVCAVASGAAAVGDFALGWAVRPVLDVVYPTNPINGYRHFVGIPRSLEKLLGDWIIYPLATDGKRSTYELLPNTNVSIANKVDEVVERLSGANQELLNPKNETAKFDYRAKTVYSSQINAFAVPAGGMVVFSRIVKEIDGWIKTEKNKKATVAFADGSQATVDLSDVKLEDVLAALLGHEMTHAASRHSIVSIVASLMRKALLSVGRTVLLGYLKACDEEYQELARKPKSERSGEEKEALTDKEHLYSRLDDVFEWIEEQIEKFSSLFNSRTNEYEADVTGTYFAAQAKYNPLGAICLQEILNHDRGVWSDFGHKNFEFLYTHPYGENRKRAIFAAIKEIKPEAFKGRLTWNRVDNGYDLSRSSPAVKYASQQFSVQ